jgi:hypothetical protein
MDSDRSEVIPFADVPAGAERRAAIMALEAHMTALPEEQQRPDVLEPTHYFARGVYCRRMDIPAGICVVGKLHKHSQITMLIQGELTLYSELGTVRMKAPHIAETPAGVKRVAFAHSDSVIVTAHGTDITDPEKIEDELIAKSYEELEAFMTAERLTTEAA